MHLHPQVPEQVRDRLDCEDNLQKAAEQWWLDDVQDYEEESFQKDTNHPVLRSTMCGWPHTCGKKVTNRKDNDKWEPVQMYLFCVHVCSDAAAEGKASPCKQHKDQSIHLHR